MGYIIYVLTKGMLRRSDPLKSHVNGVRRKAGIAAVGCAKNCIVIMEE